MGLPAAAHRDGRFQEAVVLARIQGAEAVAFLGRRLRDAVFPPVAAFLAADEATLAHRIRVVLFPAGTEAIMPRADTTADIVIPLAASTRDAVTTMAGVSGLAPTLA